IIADGYGKNPINFDVSDLKGYKQLDITLKLGEGAGLLPPMGTVPLTIDKEGNDIKLSWDFAAYGNDILIYYLKGDGTGQYTNSFASWAPASLYNPSSVIGSLYDKNQFLDGDKERYYKAIKNDQIPEAKVPVAWAVGKIIIDVSKGYDFISMPLIPFKGTSISNVFMGQLDVQGVESYSFDELTVMMSKANFTNGAWAYSPNVPFGISSGKSYWLQLPADQKLSLIGAVKTTPFTKAMPANGYVTLGATLPTLIDFQTVGLTAKNGDQIYYFNNITKLFEKISDSGGWQNATPGQKVFSFIPAAGYWYKNEGASFDWIK
ncbi:hypothetical protein HZC34_06140, partial [Candidatus Saganbacteria bacterium]|nr:hypothetical protein [Candidatus Saganbacteria bacterium]